MPTTNIIDNLIEKPPSPYLKWIDWRGCLFYLLYSGLSIFQRDCQNTSLLMHLFILNSAAITSSGTAPLLTMDTTF